MTRTVDRLNSQAAEDKDPKAVRPDIVGKRQLAEHIVEDREDPVDSIATALAKDRVAEIRQREAEARDQDRYLRNLTSTEGKP